MVVPLEQVRKEGSRVSFHCEPQWIGIVQYCVVDTRGMKISDQRGFDTSDGQYFLPDFN